MSQISIALVGESYYICGPRGNNVGSAATQDFREVFDHSGLPNIHHKYVALGEKGNYYLRYFDSNTGNTRASMSAAKGSILLTGIAWRLGSYPGLDKHLSTDAKGDPICVSLGEDGNYFMRDAWGAAWRLPKSITDRHDMDDGDDPVDRLFLGKDDAYFAQTRGGSSFWNFRGNYGSLDSKVKYSDDVRCLSMNLLDDRSYVLLLKNHKFACSPGQAGRNGLTNEVFKAWAERL